jgi:hypothetical protein
MQSSSSFTNPCGLSLLIAALRENRFCNFFIFHHPVPKNRLQTLSSFDKPLRIHRL